jgi:hypothetical protein
VAKALAACRRVRGFPDFSPRERVDKFDELNKRDNEAED